MWPTWVTTPYALPPRVRGNNAKELMAYRFMARQDEAAELGQRLSSAASFALDCEAAGFHRYSDRLCLIQVTVDEVDYIVDPLAFDPAKILRDAVENPDIRLIMHGGDYDLRLLDRDLGLRPVGVFDTQIAASLIGEESLGLSALLEKYLGIKLAKKYQRADWAKRPLPPEMLDYAASDTRYLARLASLLAEKVESLGRTEWAAEEFELLQQVQWQPDDAPVDPVSRVKGAKDLEPRPLERLRRTLEWRDATAKALDRAPFRVMDDRTLLTLASAPPADLDSLTQTKGVSRSLARDRGDELLRVLREADEVPLEDIDAFPRPERTGPGRPPPEVEARFERLKRLRNRLAGELGIARGTLFPNATLLDVAREAPVALEALGQVASVKRWQLALAGDQLLEVLKDG